MRYLAAVVLAGALFIAGAVPGLAGGGAYGRPAQDLPFYHAGMCHAVRHHPGNVDWPQGVPFTQVICPVGPISTVLT